MGDGEKSGICGWVLAQEAEFSICWVSVRRLVHLRGAKHCPRDQMDQNEGVRTEVGEIRGGKPSPGDRQG